MRCTTACGRPASTVRTQQPSALRGWSADAVTVSRCSESASAPPDARARATDATPHGSWDRRVAARVSVLRYISFTSHRISGAIVFLSLFTLRRPPTRSATRRRVRGAARGLRSGPGRGGEEMKKCWGLFAVRFVHQSCESSHRKCTSHSRGATLGAFHHDPIPVHRVGRRAESRGRMASMPVHAAVRRHNLTWTCGAARHPRVAYAPHRKDRTALPRMPPRLSSCLH